MINYLAKYIPNMSELTAPLRSLLKSDVPWACFPEHDTALTKLKSVLSSAPVLRFCGRSLPTTLQVDASKSGLGACLMQQNQPVVYASRAMSAFSLENSSAFTFGCSFNDGFARFQLLAYIPQIP
jgi:hypothetical protein